MIANQRVKSYRRGYLFVELMVVLAVMGVFAIVAGDLTVTTLKGMGQTQRRQETANRFDLAINRLRTDVWSAQLIEADGPSATLHEPDGQIIVWRAEPEADEPGSPNPYGPSIRLTRRAWPANVGPGPTQPTTAPASQDDFTQWEPLPAGIAFVANGATLTTHVPSSDDRFASDARDGITMVSQLQLLTGGKP